MTEEKEKKEHEQKEHDDFVPSCCETETKEEAEPKHEKRNKAHLFPSILIGVLSVVIVGNIVALGIFTNILNSKLGDAISLTQPQQGTLTLLSASNCPMCVDISSIEKKILSQNVDAGGMVTVMYDSEEGKSLVSRLNIEKIPALVFESDVKINSALANTLKEGSRKVGENALVWEAPSAPFIDVKSNTVAGLVSVTYVADKNCTACYNPSQVHGTILRRYGMAIKEEITVDIATERGKALIEQYQITSIPTVVLSQDASQYPVIVNVWGKVGTNESDGNFVFRSISSLGKVTYRDLENNKVIENGS